MKPLPVASVLAEPAIENRLLLRGQRLINGLHRRFGGLQPVQPDRNSCIRSVWSSMMGSAPGFRLAHS
jgi:hypothetical protein